MSPPLKNGEDHRAGHDRQVTLIRNRQHVLLDGGGDQGVQLRVTFRGPQQHRVITCCVVHPLRLLLDSAHDWVTQDQSIANPRGLHCLLDKPLQTPVDCITPVPNPVHLMAAAACAKGEVPVCGHELRVEAAAAEARIPQTEVDSNEIAACDVGCVGVICGKAEILQLETRLMLDPFRGEIGQTTPLTASLMRGGWSC